MPLLINDWESIKYANKINESYKIVAINDLIVVADDKIKSKETHFKTNY